MNLSLLKQLKRNSVTRSGRNPYSLKVRRDQFYERAIDAFLAITQPLFLGEHTNHQEPENISPLPPEKLTYVEWELNQHCFTLLMNDLIQTINIVFSMLACRITDNQAVFMIIFFESEEDVLDTKKNTYGLWTANLPAQKRISIISREDDKNTLFWQIESMQLMIDQIEFRNLIKRPQRHHILVTSLLKTLCYWKSNIIMYRIRGPALIKNLLILFANNRN